MLDGTTAVALWCHLQDECAERAREGFQALLSLREQRAEDAVGGGESTTDPTQRPLVSVQERLLTSKAEVVEVLAGLLQQRLFLEATASTSATVRRNAWLFLGELVLYVSAPGSDASTLRAVRHRVRRRLWREYGWVYAGEIAYYLIRRRRRDLRLSHACHQTDSCAASEAASSSARDDESCWMMRHVLPTVLRHARPLPPIRDDGTAGESLWSPGDVMDGDEELLVENSAQPVSSADAYALLVAVYSAWRESPLDTSSSLLAGSPWSPTPSPDWLEWLLSRDTLWLRWWALPAVAAAAAATDAIDDAMLRETDRRTYERRLALALAQVQLCREWLVVVAAPPLQISEYGRDGSGGADAAKEGGRESEVRAPDTLMIPRPTSNASRALPHVLLADGGAVSALHDAFGGRCLEPTEQRDVLQRVLHDDPTLLHRANIRGVQLVTLLERHPVEFVSALTRHLLATSTSRAEEYLQALAQLPVSVTSLSLVHAVHRRDLFRHFVSHACARLTPRPLDHTAARQEQLLAALVLRALEEEEEEAQQHQRTGEHTVSVSSVISKELGAELRTWALRASRLHTVARLYRALARYAQSPP